MPDVTTREANAAEQVQGAALELAQAAYPTDGTFPVSFETSEARTPLFVESRCPVVPDYYIVPLFEGEFLTGIVVLDRISVSTVKLAMVNPIGPAYQGPDSAEPHGLVRERMFPPFDAAWAVTQFGGEYYGVVYVCDATPEPQLAAYHALTIGRGELLVSILDGTPYREPEKPAP